MGEEIESIWNVGQSSCRSFSTVRAMLSYSTESARNLRNLASKRDFVVLDDKASSLLAIDELGSSRIAPDKAKGFRMRSEKFLLLTIAKN